MSIHFIARQKIVFLTLFLSLVACSSSKKVNPVIDDNPAPALTGALDESFDPMSLDDGDISFPDANVEALNTTAIADNTRQEPQTQQNRLVDGFRIQLFAAKDIELVTVEKKEAEFLFLNDGVRVYIEFDSPLYKLRIGDCVDRETANQLRELAKSRGYASAWIAKTKVNSAFSNFGTTEE